jgi:NAD(P)-dependent dehydrogenase (short-subunit alcohol dehydrogenase family)
MAQVWLVTGSSRGLGRAIVEAGLLAGNKVLATARNIESLRELSERYGDQVKLFELDVTDESLAAGAVKTAIDAFGSLDVVINNAGYGNLSSFGDVHPKTKPGDSGRDGRDDTLAGQFFHEQIQEDGFHSLQRWIASPQFSPECRSARLASSRKSCKTKLRDSNEQIMCLIRESALFLSQPAPPKA